MHLIQDELSELLNRAKQQVEVGGFYTHYKSKDMVYKVKDVVIQESDNRPCVIYQAQYGNKLTFSRPLDAWLQKVEVDDTLKPRFTKITQDA